MLNPSEDNRTAEGAAYLQDNGLSAGISNIACSAERGKYQSGEFVKDFSER